MITCPKCSKENQDHYKFCLGCGAELPRDASPKKFAADTPPHGIPAARGVVYEEPSTNIGPAVAVRPAQAGSRSAPPAVAEPAAYAPPMQEVKPLATPIPAPPVLQSSPPGATGAPGSVVCPQCQEPNPLSNKFCALCGFKLAKPQSAPAPTQAAAAPAAGGTVLTALRADGTEAGTYTLPSATSTIGRDTGAIFAGDSYLSPRHATFSLRGGRLYVKDESSLNGVYRRLRREDPILMEPGDIFRVGQEIIRIEALSPSPTTPDGVERLGSPAKGYVARIALIIGRDTTGNAFPVPDTGLHLGRERGDILFPEDGYVSGLHCQITYQGGQLYLTDLGSSNGTFIRVFGETEIQSGDILLMGQQLFRVNT